MRYPYWARLAAILGMLCATMAFRSQVLAQNYPAKPVRIVTAEPGGGADFLARLLAQGLAQELGQQVIIDNRPSGVVPAEAVAQAPADGYTLLFYSNGMWTLPLIQRVSYDPLRDFMPVMKAGSAPNILVVHPSLPVKSVKELIAQAKAGAGKFNIGTINIGTTQFLSAELLKSMTGIDSTTVPFNNTAGVLTALRGNNVQAAIEFLPPVLGQVRANSLRAIAVTSKSRFALLPDVPTLTESGVPGYEVSSWNGIAVAAKTPKAVVERLNREIHAAVNSPQIRARFQELGVEQNTSTADGMRKFLVDEIAKWNALIDKANIPRL